MHYPCAPGPPSLRPRAWGSGGGSRAGGCPPTYLLEIGLGKGAELAARLLRVAPQLHLHRLGVPQLLINCREWPMGVQGVLPRLRFATQDGWGGWECWLR